MVLAPASAHAMRLGQNCRKRRAALSMSQAVLSKRSGIAASYLSNIENGLGNPTLEILEAISAALRCSVVDLLDVEEPI